MKVKPMIFNTEMVKAILEGKKTVTRRPAKNLSFSERMGFAVGEFAYGLGFDLRETMNNCIKSKSAKCPAQIGDLIYVRETFLLGRIFDYDSGHPASDYFYVEQVQDISEEQAEKEGCSNFPSYRGHFEEIWNSIYQNWKENPYVWVIEFEVIHQNVDKYLSEIGHGK
jgi:hypothetical protein